MIIRKTDAATRDWTFGKGLADYATDAQAIAENIQTRILSWVGDCFFALSDGVDWRNRLEVGQQTALRDEVSALILKSFGVISVDSVDLNFNPDNRLESLTYSITTIFSPSFEATIAIAAGALGS